MGLSANTISPNIAGTSIVVADGRSTAPLKLSGSIRSQLKLALKFVSQESPAAQKLIQDIAPKIAAYLASNPNNLATINYTLNNGQLNSISFSGSSFKAGLQQLDANPQGFAVALNTALNDVRNTSLAGEELGRIVPVYKARRPPIPASIGKPSNTINAI